MFSVKGLWFTFHDLGAGVGVSGLGFLVSGRVFCVEWGRVFGVECSVLRIYC